MEKTYKKISELHNWKDNPRGIKKDAFQELKDRIKRWGQFKPLVVTKDGEVIGGNMRLRAYREMGINDIWVSEVEPKDEAEKIEIALTDNEELGYYEEDAVAELIAKYEDKIKLGNYSIQLGGYKSLDKLLDEYRPVEVVEDDVPELPKEAKSEYGKVYELGRHRLMCGDSTNEADVEKLMNGMKAKTLFTSPPYNMAGGMYESYDDNLKSKEYIDFNLKVFDIWSQYIDGYAFWNISYNKNSRWEFLEIMYRLVKDTGFRFLEMIVWDKGHGLPITSKDMLTREYEDILFIGKDKQVQKDIDLYYVGTKYNRANFYKSGFTGTTNYWRVVPNKVQRKDHLAIYPVMIPAKGIMLSTQIGDVVVDPFGGSGSTLIACEQLDRTCNIMEIDPKYCDVIRERYDNFINQK